MFMQLFWHQYMKTDPFGESEPGPGGLHTRRELPNRPPGALCANNRTHGESITDVQIHSYGNVHARAYVYAQTE